MNPQQRVFFRKKYVSSNHDSDSDGQEVDDQTSCRLEDTSLFGGEGVAL